jgi:putative transposase
LALRRYTESAVCRLVGDSQRSEIVIPCHEPDMVGKMGRALDIRDDRSASELRLGARREKDGRAAARMIAIANALEGMTRAEAARLAGMERQALRDAVIRYNAEGLEGLHDRPRSGPGEKLNEGQQAALVALIFAGPDLERDGTGVWRLKDLAALVERRFGVRYSISGLFDLLKRLGVSWMSARPQHPRADQKAQQTFKKTFPTPAARSPRRIPRPSASRSGLPTRAASARRGG